MLRIIAVGAPDLDLGLTVVPWIFFTWARLVQPQPISVRPILARSHYQPICILSPKPISSRPISIRALDQKQEREAAVLARKQKTYQLLYSDDDNDGAGGIVNKSLIATASDSTKNGSGRRLRVKRMKKMRLSNKWKKQDGLKDGLPHMKMMILRYSFVAEQERLRDQGEREQLERNIRERDAAGTCKLTEPKLKKKEEEEAVRRSNALEKNELDTLRKVSRQEYLKKREQKKLEEIRDDIEDEQYLFDGVKLTEAEYHELR
ncbi:hypothetical protein DKX38_022240 [Salix brachista]|uniref:Uncharacterized protein n=1 Tax=Salix brachista TaxID=2182728 RepID=A0A5N5JZ41_9ROSI|nr:hypothetical protein DKX38_022240 [Salix brachista]